MLSKVHDVGSISSAKVNYKSNNKCAKDYYEGNIKSAKVNNGIGKQEDANDQLYNLGKDIYKNRKEIAKSMANNKIYNAGHDATSGTLGLAASSLVSGGLAVGIGAVSIVRGVVNGVTDNSINKFENEVVITNESLEMQQTAARNKGMIELGKSIGQGAKKFGIGMYEEGKEAVNNAIKTERNVIRPLAERLVNAVVKNEVEIFNGIIKDIDF